LAFKAPNPTLDGHNKLEKVAELRIEMIYNPLKRQEVVDALKESHPYEEVAYEVYKLESY
jgi:hypothetical protein